MTSLSHHSAIRVISTNQRARFSRQKRCYIRSLHFAVKPLILVIHSGVNVLSAVGEFGNGDDFKMSYTAMDGIYSTSSYYHLVASCSNWWPLLVIVQCRCQVLISSYPPDSLLRLAAKVGYHSPESPLSSPIVSLSACMYLLAFSCLNVVLTKIT